MRITPATTIFVAFAAFLAPCFGQGPKPPQITFDQVVDRAIFQENTLLKILRGQHPVAETYIQDMGPDADFGAVPKSDHYFLGKLDLSRGVTTDSFVSQTRAKTRPLDVFAHLFSVQYMPRGF